MNVYDSFFNVRAIVLDIDGVFTDNTILITEQGEFLRSMNVRDGYAIKRALKAGLQMAVISGGNSAGTRKRFEMLGISEIHLGIEHKLEVMNDVLQKWKLDYKDVAYMGDDLPDLEIMERTGLACCPNDAVPEILQVADYISPISGGKGCVRDLIEKILQAQEKW
jgi:3-deoxy-D-manno-octulosonate 8-phosphate phosphatase (KDO 8-P phosphatase)